MKNAKVPLMILFLCVTAFVLTLALTAQQLPERVASHFGPTGVANGWMSRSGHLWTIGGLALGLSIVLPALFYFLRFLPASSINLPNRDYWLAPERRHETHAVFFAAGVWLACFLVLLMLGLHLLVVQANASQPPRMSDAVWLLVGGFLLVDGVWIYLLVRRFSKVA